MKFNISLELDSASPYAQNVGTEDLRRMFAVVSRKLSTSEPRGILSDLEGNPVGKWELTEK